jgi:hypothetical protein
MKDRIKDPIHISSVPSYLWDSNMIFHYTKTDTAIAHILFKNQLRLNRRMNASDPMEKLYHPLNTNQFYSPNDSAESIKKGEVLSDYKRDLNHSLEMANQLSFCLNNYTLPDLKYADDLGFLKFRMWDQYAAQFHGVCLCFDQDILLASENYTEFSDSLNHPAKFTSGEVDYKHLLGFGIKEDESQSNNLEGILKKKLLTKQKSYEDEKELRLLNFNERGEYYLPFTKEALKAIFYFTHKASGLKKKHHFLNDFQRHKILEYAKTNQVDVFELEIQGYYQEVMISRLHNGKNEVK